MFQNALVRNISSKIACHQTYEYRNNDILKMCKPYAFKRESYLPRSDKEILIIQVLCSLRFQRLETTPFLTSNNIQKQHVDIGHIKFSSCLSKIHNLLLRSEISLLNDFKRLLQYHGTPAHSAALITPMSVWSKLIKYVGMY
jgi:hypothetical protein